MSKPVHEIMRTHLLLSTSSVKFPPFIYACHFNSPWLPPVWATPIDTYCKTNRGQKLNLMDWAGTHTLSYTPPHLILWASPLKIRLGLDHICPGLGVEFLARHASFTARMKPILPVRSAWFQKINLLLHSWRSLDYITHIVHIPHIECTSFSRSKIQYIWSLALNK